MYKWWLFKLSSLQRWWISPYGIGILWQWLEMLAFTIIAVELQLGMLCLVACLLFVVNAAQTVDYAKRLPFAWTDRKLWTYRVGEKTLVDWETR